MFLVGVLGASLFFCICSSRQHQQFNGQLFKSGLEKEMKRLQPVHTIESSSSLDCGVRCQEQANCEAITFDMRLKLCHFHSSKTSASSSTGKGGSQGTYFYKLDSSQRLKQRGVQKRLLIAEKKKGTLMQYNIDNRTFSVYKYISVPSLKDIKYVREWQTLYLATANGWISSAKIDQANISTIKKLNNPSLLCVDADHDTIFVILVNMMMSKVAKLSLNGNDVKIIYSPKKFTLIVSVAKTADRIFLSTSGKIWSLDFFGKNVKDILYVDCQAIYISGDTLYYDNSKHLYTYSFVNKTKTSIRSIPEWPLSIIAYSNKIYISFDAKSKLGEIDLQTSSNTFSKFGSRKMHVAAMTLVT